MTWPERAIPYRKLGDQDADSRVPSDWLACYPVFQEALEHASTRFGALPLVVKQVALKRIGCDPGDYQTIAPTLDDVGASYVELSTGRVDAVVRQYLGEPAGGDGAQAAKIAAQLDELAVLMPGTRDPEAVRPPCLLSPGGAVFLEGWMRFFTYRSRGDLTIPLLALDWPRFVERLEAAQAQRA